MKVNRVTKVSKAAKANVASEEVKAIRVPQVDRQH